MVYHLLDEPFSAVAGLGIATVVANIMRFDDSVVVCPEADDTRGIDADRIVVIPLLRVIVKVKGLRFVPFKLRRALICRIFDTLLSRLEKGDIVWCHNFPYVAAALVSAIHSKGAKLVFHSHNSLASFKGISVFKSFAPDALIFNSEAMRQEALALLPHLTNTYTVHNGADEARFYPRPKDGARNHDAPVVLYVGRLVHAKGVHVLIEAMRILNERNVRAVCKIVGSSHAGGDKGKTTSYIDSLHDRCPPDVHFEGFRSGTDIAEDYRSADVLCVPSIWKEPFGNVNVEAMACGVPVVASRVGGILEIASDGGIVLVEPESAVELAGALERLILDEDLRAKIGAEGLSSFQQRFTWPAIVRQHREIAQTL